MIFGVALAFLDVNTKAINTCVIPCNPACMHDCGAKPMNDTKPRMMMRVGLSIITMDGSYV